MLFPFGKIPKIPGKTLREKSLSLISSHIFYRCGRLQCSLILFLYNAISCHNASFVQNSLSYQKTRIPNGSSRDIPTNFRRRDDPAFPEYWFNKQSQVRAMCSELGDPDLMVTFTFVNKWPEVKESEENVNSCGYDKVDIRFCPFEEMMIWNQRFFDIKEKRFEELIKYINFGNAIHYCWRLEFQARGAPHVHALIWLEDRLSLDTISKNFFAHLPDTRAERLYSLVTKNMIHNCLVSRCKGGIESAACKYGFPKPACDIIHVNSDGNLLIPRNDEESRIVEYSPYFLLKWGGHCHINILRNEEHMECSSNAIHYIVKYNFKSEPNISVEVDNSDSTFQTRFHARIVSVEEATTKIASVDYFGSSMSSIYITIKSPEERQATYKKGEQTQITNVEKYFNRPPELERLGVLSFFSYYNINPTSISNSQRIDQLKMQFGDNSGKYLYPDRPKRPQNSLSIDSKWEEENLPNTQLINKGMLLPSNSLLNARALQISLKIKPQIVLTERFTCISNIEDFAYVYIMLSGSWRSDDEMKAEQETWLKALEFHGLTFPNNDGMLQYYQLLIKYMIESPRYGTRDLLRNISMMNYDMTTYLEVLKTSILNSDKPKIDEVINELNKLKQAMVMGITDINDDANDNDLNRHICFSWTEAQINAAKNKFEQDFLPKLNAEQSYIFNEISSRLKSHQQINAFIKGRAGTGKSFVIHTIINYLISNSIPYIVCASTGIAACLINGKTVHSAFGLFSNKQGKEDEDVICSLDVSKPNGYAMTKVQVIIIDEVTMISGKVLGAMEWGLRKIMAQIKSPLQSSQFGGKSILLFGDLAQVPAVTMTRDDFLESLAQFHENHNFDGFVQWELKILMRQSQDENMLIKILDYIRYHQDDKTIEPEIEDALKNLFVPGLIEDVIDVIDDFVGNDDPEGMIITFTNKNAQLYNQLILEKRMKATKCQNIVLKSSFYVLERTHFIQNPDETEFESIRRQAALSVTRIASDGEVKLFCGAMKKRLTNTIIPFSLNIIPNARVMLLQNLNMSIGLINGARGTVMEYLNDVDVISVKFDFQSNNENPILITRRRSAEYQINNGKKIFMYMFPLKLSWAVTAHKSQGQTLSKAAINVGENAFAHGSFYVALSRVKSIGCLKLFGLQNWPQGGPNFHMNPYIQSKENEQAENEFI